ncbi:MAG: urease accessory protein UreF [Hyphomicrobiaceae bacterium]
MDDLALHTLSDESSAETPARSTTPFAPELLIWFSSAFPTGAFAFSHGLERLVEVGTVTDRVSLTAWLRALAREGSLRNDLILIAESWRLTLAHDTRALAEIVDLATAFTPSAERRLETTMQGGAFAAAVAAAWPSPTVARLLELETTAIAMPVAVGVAAADRGLALAPTVSCYAIAFATNLISAAIRLSLIGQFDGQRVLADLVPDLQAAAAQAVRATVEDLGGAMLLGDIASMEHETQHTRLFRS